jgi:hypothetical protein
MNTLLLRVFSHVAAGATLPCPDGTSTCDTGLPTVQATSASLQSILQVSFGVIGGIAVIMIMYGGLQFILAQGDPQNTVRARKTIIYAIVGLGIAISAEAIVTFVLGKLP